MNLTTAILPLVIWKVGPGVIALYPVNVVGPRFGYW